ncbi:MAG TPA: ABC transporter permease [Chloroflexi bacterium]|nr:ABC transporter permease [Chloroflexota bacterium]
MKWLFLPIRRTWSIARKEFVHVLMDPGALFLTIFAPAVVLTLLAYIFTFDIDESNIAVVDMDQTPTSAEYIRTLTSDGYLHIVGYPRNYDEAVALLDSDRADAALIIPPGFGETLSAGGYAPVHNVVDGIDAPAARQVMNAVQQRTQIFAARMGLAAPPPIEVRTRVWFNENMTSQHSMVPGLMALVLILPAMAVALGITREKESGTLETLVTTPVLSSDVLVGKVAVYLTLGLVSALISLAVAIFWFGVPFRGSLLAWIVATAAYLMACMAFSLVVASFARSQQTAMVIILLVLFMPGFLMSGLSDPVSRDAAASWIFSNLLPTTHYITLSRGIALKGLSLLALWRDSAALAIMGLLGLVLAIMMFRKKIA